jgi:hypothetical protein
MALTRDNDTSLHEAGHCIISYLAHDLFEIKYVTSNFELSMFHDSTSIGGLRGSLKKEFGTLTFEDHDLMILIFLAGMAADDINYCNGILTEQLYENAVFAQKMNSNKYSGDSTLLMPHLQRLVPELFIEQRQYTISCQKLLHELFVNNKINPILLELRDELENSSKKTLTNREITSFLDDTELKNWRETEWQEIIKNRISEIKKTAHNSTLPKAGRSFLQKLFGSE